MRYEDQTRMHPSQPLSPTTVPPHCGWENTTQYALANSNLHQPLISFLYMIPVKEMLNNVEKMYKRDAKYEIILTRNLITETKYYYEYLI